MTDPARRDRLRELLDAVVDADNTDVGDMARSSYASEFHFSREVRRLTGESPAALRRRIMLERAAWRLHGGESVSAVAADEGWSSAEVFSRAFSRAFGVPPSRAADIQFRLPAPNGLHFHPPGSLWLDSDGGTKEPDISQLMVAHDVAELHPKLVSAAAGKDVWVVGGGNVAAQFVTAGLIDEIIVTYAPCSLGGGSRLLPIRSEWALVESAVNADFVCARWRKA